ncbi:unnamed protein product [Prunus armeniaca]
MVDGVVYLIRLSKAILVEALNMMDSAPFRMVDGVNSPHTTHMATCAIHPRRIWGTRGRPEIAFLA